MTWPPGSAREPHPYPLARAHLVVAGGVRDRTKLLGDGVAHGVGLAVFHVDGANEQVVGDVVQVPTELEPGAGSRDVVGGTLPFDLGWVSREQRLGVGSKWWMDRPSGCRQWGQEKRVRL